VDAAIETANLSCRYGRHDAVRDVTFAVVTITDNELSRYGSQVGRLTATLHYSLQRSRVIGALLLAEGAALDADAMRIEILRVQRRRDGSTVFVRQWNVSSVLSVPEYRQHDFVLRNAERREAFTAERREWGSPETFSVGPVFLAGFTMERGGTRGFALRHVGLDYPMRLPGQTRPMIDAEWLAGADIAIVETGYGGQITRTMTIEDFRIE
jgi:hypothetical protein